MGNSKRGEGMNSLAIAYNTIEKMIQNQKHHNLSRNDILALKDAQKSILAIETLGLSQKTMEINII